MRLTRKLARQQPWWLLLFVLAFFLLSTFSSAAPSQPLVRRAGDGDVLSSPPTGVAAPGGVADAAHDGASSAAPIPSWTSGQYWRDLRQWTAAQLKRQYLSMNAAKARAADRLKMGLNRARPWILHPYDSLTNAWALRQGRLRGRPRPGEVEIRPTFQLTKEQLADVQKLHRPAELTGDEESHTYGKLTPRQRAEMKAWKEGMQVTPELIAQEEAIDRAVARQRELLYEGLDRIEDEPHSPRHLPSPSGAPGTSGSASSSLSRGAESLGRAARQSLGEGLEDSAQILKNAAAKLHLRKRNPLGGSPGSQWTQVDTLRYDGAGYNFVRRLGGHVQIYRINPGLPDVEKEGPFAWNELEESERQRLRKLVPNLKQAQTDNWARAEHFMGISSDVNGRNGLYTLPGFSKDNIVVLQSGTEYRFQYLKQGRFRSVRKDALFSSLPDHLKLFITGYAQSHPDVPWASSLHRLAKRAGGESSSGWHQVDSFRYPGAGYTIVRSQGRLQFYTELPGSSHARVPQTWESMTSAERAALRDAVGKIDRAVKNGGLDAERYIRVSPHLGDPSGFYPTGNRIAHDIVVLQKGDNIRFEYLKDGFFGAKRSKASFNELPEHIKTFVRGLVEKHPDLPWAYAARQGRPVAQEPRAIYFPGQNFRLTPPPPRGSRYVIDILPVRQDHAVKSSYWSHLPPELKQHIKEKQQQLHEVIKSKIAPGQARALGVRVSDGFDDLNNVYPYPGRAPEAIRIIPNVRHAYVFERQIGTQRLAPVTFAELPQHLKRYLLDEPSIAGVLRIVTRRSFRKRSPPDQEARVVQFPGDKLRLVRAFKGDEYLFETIPARPDLQLQSMSWSELPDDVKRYIKTNERMLYKAVVGKMKPDVAQALGVRLNDRFDDHINVYNYPGRGPETIRAIPDTRSAYAFERQVNGHTLEPVPFAKLPDHIKDYLWYDDSIKDVIDAVTGRRLRKRAPPGEELPLIDYPGEKVGAKQLEDHSYVYFIRSQRPNGALQIRSWSLLPKDLREHILTHERRLYEATRDHMPADKARKQGIRVATGYEDDDNVFDYPGRGPETIRIVPDSKHVYLFQRQIDGQLQAPVKFVQLPRHLQVYLYGEESLSELIRTLPPRILRKRAPPIEENRSIQYPGQDLRLVRERDGKYYFHVLPVHGGFAIQSRKWSLLPDEVKNHIRSNNQALYKVAKSRMPVDQARAQGVIVADGVEDYTNVFRYPGRTPETIHIIPDQQHRYVFQRQIGEHLQRPVAFADLPEHLRDYLWGEDSMSSVIRAVAPSRFRFRKRAITPSAEDRVIEYPGETVRFAPGTVGNYVLERTRARSDEHQASARRSPELSNDIRSIRSHLQLEDPSLFEPARRATSDQEAAMVFRSQSSKVDVRAHSHRFPGRDPETIYIIPDTTHRFVFQRRLNGQLLDPVPFDQLPEHLRTYLIQEGNIPSVLRALGSPRRVKRSPPEQSERTIAYPAQVLRVLQNPDNSYSFALFSKHATDPDQARRWWDWSSMPQRIKDFVLARDSVLYTAADKQWPAHEARALGVRMATDISEILNGQGYFGGKDEIIHVIPDYVLGYLFQREVDGRRAPLQAFNELPNHIQMFLHGDNNVIDVLRTHGALYLRR